VAMEDSPPPTAELSLGVLAISRQISVLQAHFGVGAGSKADFECVPDSLTQEESRGRVAYVHSVICPSYHDSWIQFDEDPDLLRGCSVALVEVR